MPGSRAVDTPRLPRLHSAFDLIALRMPPHARLVSWVPSALGAVALCSAPGVPLCPYRAHSRALPRASLTPMFRLAPACLRAHPGSVPGVPPRARVFRPASRVLRVGSAARWAA